MSSENLEILDFSWQEPLPLESVNQRHQVLNSESSVLLEENSNRKYLLITNIGEHIAYIVFGDLASSNSGLPLYPGGWFESNFSNFPYVGKISGITIVGSAILSVIEGV
jgi:hypothetical protein